MIVYCATSNPGKLREFQLAAPDFDVRPLPVKVPPPEENGATFEENAAAKAEYYGQFVDGYLFADDSGLEVDALGGAPGVHSARYAGEEATDRENNALLLDRLKEATDRSARFVCVIALVKGGGRPDPHANPWSRDEPGQEAGPRVALDTQASAPQVKTFRGVVEGRILHEARGSSGFGYDPLFYYEPFGCTFGEASLEGKMRVSHRAQALAAMFTYLRNSAAT
jgi:XTP/dITP diphosphohydrolase